MTVAVDTNVIGYAVTGSAETSARATRALEQAADQATALALCPAVYAELLAVAKWDKRELDAFLSDTKIRVDWDLSREVWDEAGLAFARFARRRGRQKGSGPRRILADFLIGAHAAGIGALLTADGRFYRSNFPLLPILDV